MPIYDNNGNVLSEVSKIYDHNGTTLSQIGKVYDNNGTANSLIYSAETEKRIIIYDGSTNTGLWANCGIGYSNNAFRYYTGQSIGYYKSPYIDIKNSTTLTITFFAQAQLGGNVRIVFGFLSEQNPNVYAWYRDSGTASYGTWQGPSLSGTYDISSLNGKYRLMIETACSNSSTHTYLGTTYITYFAEE